MNHYQQSIAIFGIAIPVLLGGAAIGGAVYVKARVSRSFESKLTHYKSFEQNKDAARSLEHEISSKRQHFERWDQLLGDETASTVTSNLREIEEALPSKEFQKTAQEHPASRSGIAAASAQNAAQVKLAFRATYRSMQKAFLELESRMPQLQMQELRIDPSPNSGNLNFHVTYTAWEQ